MNMTEISEVTIAQMVRAIAEYPGNHITYSAFDQMACIGDEQESLDKQSVRQRVMNRVNTIAGNGIVIDDQVRSFVLRVGQRGDHFRRETMGDAALEELRSLRKKLSRAIDNANRRAAFTLGLPAFESLVDGRRKAIRKEAPPLDESARFELQREYRESVKRKRIIQFLIEEEEESQEFMASLMSKKPKQIEHTPQF